MTDSFIQIDLCVSRVKLKPHSSRRSFLCRDRIFRFGLRCELVRHRNADGFLLLRSVQLQRDIFKRGERRAIQRNLVARRIVAIAGRVHMLLERKVQKRCRSRNANRVFQFLSAEAGRGAAFPVDRDRAVLQADRHIFQRQDALNVQNVIHIIGHAVRFVCTGYAESHRIAIGAS